MCLECSKCWACLHTTRSYFASMTSLGFCFPISKTHLSCIFILGITAFLLNIHSIGRKRETQSAFRKYAWLSAQNTYVVTDVVLFGINSETEMLCSLFWQWLHMTMKGSSSFWTVLHNVISQYTTGLPAPLCHIFLDIVVVTACSRSQALAVP